VFLAVILASQGRLTSDDVDVVDSDDDGATGFDEFNFWRVPVAEPDVADLIRCLHEL